MWGVISYLGGILIGASVLLLTLDLGYLFPFAVFLTGWVVLIFGKYKKGKLLKK